MTNLKGQTIEQYQKITHTASKLLGTTERDGFGHATLTDGGIYLQRYVEPKDVKPNLHQFRKSFTIPNSNESGKLAPPKGAAMWHGRISTNDKTLINTHPIVKHGWTLIHNGVVEDSGAKYDMITTNDTEHCLERLVQGIGEVEKHITGYYALAAIDPNGKLHIVKDDIARLHCAWVTEAKSYIFATTKDLIVDMCAKMKWTYDTIEAVADNQYLIFDQDGLLVHQQDIKPKGYSSYSASKSKLSLGYEWDDLDGIRTIGDLDETDEQMFLDEVTQYSDMTYSFINKNTGRSITHTAFLELKEIEMIEDYTVVRPDGTVCCPLDYYSDKLYEGRLA